MPNQRTIDAAGKRVTELERKAAAYDRALSLVAKWRDEADLEKQESDAYAYTGQDSDVSLHYGHHERLRLCAAELAAALEGETDGNL